ncbi:MAG: hypothetical protein LBJ31_08285 [Treponema sp.]|jgi:hypothetical protein|nr:hypothetical protein [Treponema sp.]
MGKRKLLIVLFHFLFLIHNTFSAEIVSDIGLDKEGIVVQFEEMEIYDLVDITGVEIFDEDYSYKIFVTPDLIDMVNEDTIRIKLLGKRFIPNTRYHIIITMKNNYIHLYTFWGNPQTNLKEYYLFPLIEIPNVRILIFRQKNW